MTEVHGSAVLRPGPRRYTISAMEYAVITAIGSDQVGIMDRLAGEVVSLEANIEESRAAILGGEFAVIMLVTGNTGFAKSLGMRLQATGEAMGLSITVKPTSGPAQPMGLPYVIESLSLDTPGVVHAITSVLKANNINIEDLESGVRAAPLSGSPMFSMRIAFNIKPGASLAALRKELARVASEHDLDIEVHPAKATAISS